MRATTGRRRAPEYVSTQVRKAEPVGGGMVRLFFSLERDGTWDDQFTVLMSVASLPNALGFAMMSAREIAAEIEAPRENPPRAVQSQLRHSLVSILLL
jgi:hypothetical protein